VGTVTARSSQTRAIIGRRTGDKPQFEFIDNGRGCCAENFIDPRKLPNLMTELTDEKLPANARARFERMLERNKVR
jgi:hypothetical protein